MAEISLRDRIASEVTEGMDKATTVVGSHASDIMGSELGGVVDDVKNLASGAFDFIQGSMKTMFGFGGKDTDEQILDETETQTGFLQELIDIFKLQNLEDQREFDGDESFLTATLMAIGIALSMALGGIVGAILLPFQLLIKGLKPLGTIFTLILRPFKAILKAIKKLPGVGKITGLFTRLSGWFKSIVTSIKGLPGVGKLSKVFTKLTG